MKTSVDMQKRVEDLVSKTVEAVGLYLEEVEVKSGGHQLVRVVVDLPSGPGGVDLDTVADLSRQISNLLDDVDVIEGSYDLEVTTPGFNRPLTEPRHFSRAEGRLLRFCYAGTEQVARLVAYQGDKVSLQSVNSRPGKTQAPVQIVPIAELSRVRLEPDFHG